MSQTQIRGTQLLNSTVQRQDLDTSTVGQAVVAKIIQGTNVTISSTGGDSGTGDVTISVPGGGVGPPGPVGPPGFFFQSGTYDLSKPSSWTWNSSAAATTGIQFQVSFASTLTKISFYKGASETSTSRTVALWDAGGTLIYSQSTSGEPSGPIWIDVTLTTPQNLTANVNYTVSTQCFQGYSYITPPPVTSNGPITWQNGQYIFAAGLVYPSTTYNANYGLDFTVTTTGNDAPNDGNIYGRKSAAWHTLLSTDAGNIATLGSDSLILVPQSQIWNVRLRSFNAIGNPNFEVDQRTCFTGTTAAGAFALDRWTQQRTGTMTSSAIGTNTYVVIPGSISYAITQYFLRVTLTAQQASLGAADFLHIDQAIEAQNMREIFMDVSSLSLLVRSSVAGLKFGCSLRNSGADRSLIKLGTIPSASTWTLVTFPNIPSFNSAGGTWNYVPGNVGYYLAITLACGTTNTAPANDIWQTGNFVGAVGQDNFASKPTSSTFDLAFVQHEPGPLCTQLMDLDFATSLDRCQRYFQKSYDYGVKPGSTSNNGLVQFLLATGSTVPQGPVPFKRTMAKAPTITGYSNTTGAINSVRDATNAIDRAITAVNSQGDSGFAGFFTSTTPAGAWWSSFQYTADTGW